MNGPDVMTPWRDHRLCGSVLRPDDDCPARPCNHEIELEKFISNLDLAACNGGLSKEALRAGYIAARSAKQVNDVLFLLVNDRL